MPNARHAASRRAPRPQPPATPANDTLRERIRALDAGLRAFNQTDLPAYNRWMHGRFEPLLAHIRETRALIQEREDLIDRVDAIAFEHNLPHPAAWRRLAEPYAAPPWFEECSTPNAGSHGADDGGAGGADPEEDALYNELSRAFAELSGEGESTDPAEAADRHRRLKAAYRELARRLHPDTHPAADALLRARWLETQEAYHDGDLFRLESILTLLELTTPDDPPPAPSATDSDRLRRTADWLQEQVAARQRHPAWLFTRSPDHAGAERDFERAHRRDLAGLQIELRRLEQRIQSWSRPPRARLGHTAAPPRPRATPASGKGRVWIQLEFPFDWTSLALRREG